MFNAFTCHRTTRLDASFERWESNQRAERRRASATGTAKRSDRAVDLLRRVDHPAAAGVTRSAVRDFRIGGDKILLPLAMTLHAVALASTRDVPGARQATVEAADRLRRLPPALADEMAVLQQTLAVLQRQLNREVPDPAAMVAEALASLDSL